MTESEALDAGEVAILPVDVERGIALVLGAEVTEGQSLPVPKGLIADALTVGGLLGGASASKSLLDGSLVRLSPQTMARIRQGAVFARDKQDVAYGTLKEGHFFSDAVRFVDGPANAVAGQMMLQTMAVQMQLKQIQETLEDINEKLDTLLKSEQHGVLAEVVATGRAVEELNDKVAAGHRLSDADEVKLRDYQDIVRTHLAEAELWLRELNGLLELEDPSLRAQYEALDGALRREPVAFWLRVYIVSHVGLGEIRKLLLMRAAAAEPEYARDLHTALQEQFADSAKALQSLCHDIDRYLRRSDIANGLEELSIRRKAKVRRLRRQLWEVDEQLKVSLSATRGLFDAVPALEPVEVPDPLDRRIVEPWVVRDNLHDAAVKASDRGSEALATAADRGSQVLRRFADKRQAEREEEQDPMTEDK